MEMTKVFELRDRYFSKKHRKETGYTVDKETGAIIVYALEAVYSEGTYYSIHDGLPLDIPRNYVQEIRNYLGHRPIQVPGTGVIIWRSRYGTKQILLQERADCQQYGLPGGGIEAGESYEECAVNELLQEAALIVPKEALKLCGLYAGPKHITRYPNGDIVYHSVAVYKVQYKMCQKAHHDVDQEETISLRWSTFADIKGFLEEDLVFPNNAPIFEDIVGGKISLNY